VKQYPGLKEGIYLWRKGQEINDRRKDNNQGFQIFIRPEPLTAQYYKARKNFLDEMICALQNKYRITVLARDETQLQYYKQPKFMNVNVPDKPLDFETIAIHCSLFIGAGGSMTRELAILGIPTISVYQDELLEVDKYLISEKLMEHETDITPEKVENFIRMCCNRPPGTVIMSKGKRAYEILKQEILKYNKHD
jgi:predicted glycosyltransferase